MKQNRKGFTLIELLVVIAIIGILAAITVVSVSGPRNQAKDTKTLSDLRNTASVLEQYYSDNNTYSAIAVTTWAALGLQLAQYGTPLPVDAGGVAYNVDIDAGGVNYCLWRATFKIGAPANTIIRCKSGAACGTVVNALPAAGTCN